MKFPNYEEALRLRTQGDTISAKYHPRTQEIERWATSSHFFKVDKELAFLLNVTDNNVKKIRLPFEEIFIDVNLKYEYETYSVVLYGLHITQPFLSTSTAPFLVNQYGEKKSSVDWDEVNNHETAIILAIGKYTIFNDPEYGRCTYPYGFILTYPPMNTDSHLRDETKLFYRYYQLSQDLVTWLANFNDFLNDPDVEYVRVKKKPMNKKSKRKKKPNQKIQMKIILKDKLKRYIQQLKTQKAFTINHKFWVRGHWRHYTSEFYKKMHGKTKWIMPYVKGKGILIKKQYELKSSEKLP